jgi:hypothetical protein
MNTRQQIIECARQHVIDRTPYQWGGGHHGESWGLDCSGLILDCFRKVGIDPGYWDSTKMREELPPVDVPQPGDLALYLPRHVVFVESFDPQTGIATIIGENGGGPSCTNLERSIELDARAKREPTHLYRDGFVGFRSIAPWGVDDWQDPKLMVSGKTAGVGVLVAVMALAGLAAWSVAAVVKESK